MGSADHSVRNGRTRGFKELSQMASWKVDFKWQAGKMQDRRRKQ